jgi:hypothetical protein
MLEYLKLEMVGPAPELEISFAPRLNIITGDNGLGKSFLLEVAWFVSTNRWAGNPARPARGVGVQPCIRFRHGHGDERTTGRLGFHQATQQWEAVEGRKGEVSIVIYAQVDGGFSVWDPARNIWFSDRVSGSSWYVLADRSSAYLFHPSEVWDGLRSDGKVLCNGLIHDWAFWQARNSEAFQQLRDVLATLSPSPTETLSPGELTRISLDDVRDIPTLRMPYGQDVPILHAAAGLKRIVALAYLLVWTWQEHVRAAELLGQEPTRRIVFLIDEIETHLHPRWQRVILRALLEVMGALTGAADVEVQIIAVTHSPLIMASLEPLFDEERDRVFHFDLRQGNVVLHDVPWAKQGDAGNWLVSEVFGLQQARSVEAERAIEAAEAFMRGDHAALPADLATRDAIDQELRRVLAGHDDFWPRWIVHVEKLSGAGA